MNRWVEENLETGMGLTFANVDRVVWNRTNGTITAGDVVTCCLLQNSSVSTNGGGTPTSDPGSANSYFACIATPGLTDQAAGLIGVAVETFSTATRGTVRFKGIASANVRDFNNNAIVPGQPVHAVSVVNRVFDTSFSSTAATSLTSRKFVGWTLGSNSTSPSTAVAMNVLFDGINGIVGVNT